MNTLLIGATPDEIPDVDGTHRAFTGIGKVNAAVNTTLALMRTVGSDAEQWRVINVGTCGAIGAVDLLVPYHIGAVVQADADVLLAFGVYAPRDMFLPAILNYKSGYRQTLPKIASCRTTDTFYFTTKGLPAKDLTSSAVCDMELAAVAQACETWRVDYHAIKVPTDRVGSNSTKDWKANQAAAREVLAAELEKIL